MKRSYPLILLCVQVVLLTLALSLWWAHRNNHLFGNKHWLVGKNMGKFVFYTYEFMFRPIVHGRVNLNRDMGNQELLYYLPEDQQRMIQRLEFEFATTSNGYLWIELQKKGQRMLACRLARKRQYKSGFYLFDQRGALSQYAPLSSADFIAPKNWGKFFIERQNNHWKLFYEGQQVGSFPDLIPSEGYFGFRGSGDTHAKVLIRNIRISFIDPENLSNKWVVKESFETNRFQSSTMTFFLFFSFFVLLFRFGRQRMLAAALPGQGGRQFITSDNWACLFLLSLLLFLPKLSSGVLIPGVLVIGEIVSVGAFIIISRRQSSPIAISKGLIKGPLLLLLVVCTLFAIAYATHGEWLGRANRSIWSKMENIHPSAFATYPPAQHSSLPFDINGPLKLVPGRPIYSGPDSFNEQRIELSFEIPDDCTFDVTFQQQSYQTHGDPDGEWLPLQRRLVRLSTRQDVPWGFSTGTRTKTAPFYKIQGTLRTDDVNTLVVEAIPNNIRVILNGVESNFPGLTVLGFGETGFSVFEKSVTLHRGHVANVTSLAKQSYLRPVWGFVFPLAFIFMLWALLFPMAGAGWFEVIRLGLAALFIPSFYLFASLMLSRDELAYFGAHRIIWLDLALIGLIISLFHIFPLFRGRLKGGVFVWNILSISLIAFIAVFIWDAVLPAGHPLRVRFRKDVTVPAEAIDDNKAISSLWYSNNRLAAANTYPWHQKFGGKSIRIPKPEDTIRIFTMGGSQAWGSGAEKSSATYDSLMENQLTSAGYPADVYNAGINGAGISRVYATFRDLILPFDPDILILNFGLNDSASLRKIRKQESQQIRREKLLEHFNAVVQLCQKHEVQLLLVQEAINKEAPLRKDSFFYDSVREISIAAGIPVIDAYTFFREKQLDHMFWWDTAHFTPAGQQALADLLAPKIEKIISNLIVSD